MVIGGNMLKKAIIFSCYSHFYCWPPLTYWNKLEQRLRENYENGRVNFERTEEKKNKKK